MRAPRSCPIVPMRLARTHDAAESDVRRGGVHRLRIARRGPVPVTVVGRAEVRSTLEHLAWDPDLRLTQIDAVVTRGAAWIARHAATVLAHVLMARRIPVIRPLPHVPDHVEEAIAIGRKHADGRSALPPILEGILVRKLPLPEVGHRPTA